MSVYSQSGIKTQYLQPHTFNSHMAEFKLDNDSCYFSNLRLANLGELRSDSGTYNDMAGAYGCIRNIFLMSNGKTIDQLRQAHRYLAFTNLMNDNLHECCVLDREAKSQLGLSVDASNLSLAQYGANSNTTTTTGAAADTRKKTLAYLPLHRCFPVLSAMASLDTGMDMFPNLTVRVEFETDRTFEYNTTINTVSQQRLEPVLIVDQVRDPAQRQQLRKAFQPVVWSSIEHDLVVIPDQIAESAALADAGTAKQEVQQKMMGFNDKYVSRIVFAKANANLALDKYGGGANTNGFGPYASKAGFLERFNLRVNGANLLPGRGLENKNAALQLLSDTYGSFGCAPFDNQLSVGAETQENNTVVYAGVRIIQGNRQNEKVGQLSYYGMSIEDKVSDLQVDYERTILKDTDVIQSRLSYGIGLHAFAEVRKSLTMEGGSMMVSYL